MDNEDDVGCAFASKACELLREYTARIQKTKSDVTAMLDKYHSNRPSQPSDWVRQRYQHEQQSFHSSISVYHKLIRQASQWLQHGRQAPPHLQLELEVRLADFERILQDMNSFFATHMPK